MKSCIRFSVCLLICWVVPVAGHSQITVDLKVNGADELIVPEGSPVRISWTTTGGPSACRATGGDWSGFKDVPAGIEQSEPLVDDTTFGIGCRLGGEFVFDQAPVTVSKRSLEGSVDLTETFDCDAEEGACVRHELVVECNDLVPQPVFVWEYPPTTLPVIGAVVLTIGGDGTGRYGADDAVRQGTVDVILDAGFEVFIVSYEDEDKGWQVYGAGLANPMCAYAHIVRWVHDTVADVPTTLCAQGNSGGATQNAYGLGLYGLSDIVDMAIMTSGPNYSKMDDFCFDPEYPAYGGPGFGENIDFFHAWDVWEPCRSSIPRDWHVTALDIDSLVSDTQPRVLHYPTTKANFIWSEGDSNFGRGKVFHDAITSAKDYYTIEGSVHGLDRTEEGAQIVRDLMLTECVDGGPPT
jgi:hypothetical protein